MSGRNQPRRIIAAAVVLLISLEAMGAPSAEINPFASTYDQVNARMARIQTEVDRLRAAGMFAAADDMSRKLAHFHGELGGIEPSLVGGPELDAVGMYTANGDMPIVEVHPSDRPIVLALGAYELVHWQLQIFPGANLQKVIVSGYDGVAMPSGVPAGVPVELSSYPLSSTGNYFYFFSKGETSFSNAAKVMYQKSGLPPTSMQALHAYLGQHFAVGAGDEWKAERVLSEMQPLYKEATAFQLAQDRTAADAYRFTGLFHTYRADGTWQSTQIAQMTPLKAVNVLNPQVDYFDLGVDPRGATTYYGYHPGHTLVRFDANSGQETALPAYSGAAGVIVALTFDTKRNRLAVATTGADSANGFLFFNPDAGTWQRSALSNSFSQVESLTYSLANDAFFAVENGANGAVKLDRFDAGTLVKTQIALSQYVNCGLDRCQLAASGDRLVLIAPPAVDVYDPLSAPLQHSYLIDPANGNVTILGALPEPGEIVGVVGLGIVMLRRRRAIH